MDKREKMMTREKKKDKKKFMAKRLKKKEQNKAVRFTTGNAKPTDEKLCYNKQMNR